MEEGPELVEEIITSLDELGVPYGSKLYHDGKVVAELGTLHHVRVNLDGSLGDKKQFKRLDAKITKALEDNSIVSAVFFNLSEDVAVFTYYVADKDLAIGVIEAYLNRSTLGKGATIDVIDSGLTIHERYMSDISRVYRGLVPDLWAVIQSEWKGVSSKEWMDLLRRYPNTPEGLSFLLNVVNGTYQKEYTSLKVTFPMCMYDDKQFYLLSARQMLEFDLHGREVMNMDILGTDVKPSQVRASSKQRDLCLFAATGEGEQASRLYIDYNPTKSGHVGQVLYFNGEDHTVTVLAPSFGEALLVLMKQESGNFGDYLIQTIMEKTMNLDVDTMDIQRADTQLLIDAMTNLAEKIMEQGAIGPMVGNVALWVWCCWIMQNLM